MTNPHWANSGDQREVVACVAEAVAALGRPRYLLDVGCGAGHVVAWARTQGLAADGVDGEDGGVVEALIVDLSQPVALAPADLVLCLEVAEHLPSSSAGILCQTLARATEGTLLFSAAIPGQGGYGHMNERPVGYWIDHLRHVGLTYDLPATLDLVRRWVKVAGACWWYPQNLVVMRRRG